MLGNSTTLYINSLVRSGETRTRKQVWVIGSSLKISLEEEPNLYLSCCCYFLWPYFVVVEVLLSFGGICQRVSIRLRLYSHRFITQKSARQRALYITANSHRRHLKAPLRMCLCEFLWRPSVKLCSSVLTLN